MGLEELPAQQREHTAWRLFCLELEKVIGEFGTFIAQHQPDVAAELVRALDLNAPEFDPMMKAVIAWGERLVELRARMPLTIQRALTEAVEAYEAVRTVPDP